jgi:hypothetical protein
MDRNDSMSSAVATGRLGVVGAWLMVLYAVTIATALLAFSAFQFQTTLGSIDSSGRALTIGELQSEQQSFDAKQELINAARNGVSTLETNLLRATEANNSLRGEMLALQAESMRVRDDGILAVRKYGIDVGEQTTRATSAATLNPESVSVRQLQQALVGFINATENKTPELDELVDEMKRTQR